MIPLLKNTWVFPGVASPLKVLILGVPILSLATGMLRRWLISASAQGGPAGCWAGSPGLLPSPMEGHFPVIHFGHAISPRDPQATLGRPHGDVAPDLHSIFKWRALSTSWSWSRWSFWISQVRSEWGSSLGCISLGEGWISTSSPKTGAGVPEGWLLVPAM